MSKVQREAEQAATKKRIIVIVVAVVVAITVITLCIVYWTEITAFIAGPAPLPEPEATGPPPLATTELEQPLVTDLEEPLLTGEPLLPEAPSEIALVPGSDELAHSSNYVFVSEADSEYVTKGHFVCLNGFSYRIEYVTHGSPTQVVLDRSLEKHARPGDMMVFGQCAAKPWIPPEVFVATVDPDAITVVSNDKYIRGHGYEAGVANYIGIPVDDSPKLKAGDTICIEGVEYKIERISPHSEEIDFVYMDRALEQTIPITTVVRVGQC